MKSRVILLGDSIRLIGYGSRTAELLGSDVQVFAPEENSRFSAFLLRQLYDYRAELEGCDLIHFNCGLWDMCDLFDDGPFTSLEVYLENVRRVVSIMKRYTSNLIFALTTPVPEANPHDKTVTIRQYNEAVAPILKELGVSINDLFTPVYAELDRCIGPDLIHLSDYGKEICAQQTAGLIREKLRIISGRG